MLKRFVLACIIVNLAAAPAHAAEEAKAAAPQAQTRAAKPNEASGKITLPDAKPADAPKRNLKWSNASLDLTHCLERGSNMDVIKCAH